MDREYYIELAKIRLERAKELLEDSQDLLSKESYRSANNRAFYAIEKCIKALLATQQIDVETHNGAVSQFNLIFIHNRDNSIFTKNDYQKIAKADRIRNASDYDDFYVVNKEETRELLDFAEDFLGRTEEYINSGKN